MTSSRQKNHFLMYDAILVGIILIGVVVGCSRTSYDSYKRGTFNLRRGHLWKDRSCEKHRCKRVRKTRCSQCSVTERVSSRYSESPRHEHYSAQNGLTRWPSAPGPDNWQAGTSGFPYVETPIWLRDTTDGAYATPTSWQGFQ